MLDSISKLTIDDIAYYRRDYDGIRMGLSNVSISNKNAQEKYSDYVEKLYNEIKNRANASAVNSLNQLFEVKNNWGGYFLKCDIRKYFYSIDHSVLKSKLGKVFTEPDVFSLLCAILDSYEVSDNIGLPLGNQASQWFTLFYLDSMDRLIKERLQIKYYTRYMDDFILIHHDKNYLRYCKDRISEHCGQLKLELNDKTQIFPIKNGVNYLGWHFYLTETGKVIRKLKTAGKKRIKGKLKLLQYKYSKRIFDFDDVKRSLVSINGHLLHGHTYRLRETLCGKTGFIRKDGD